MTSPALTHGSLDRHTRVSLTAPKLVLEPVRASSQLDSYPLAPGRYLLGAAPDCDIVIAVGGVAPQHCLMIVGANKTIVKAISPLTWINDGPLTEAVLKLGERLILGPVELRTRRPEVSEWIELREEAPAPPPAAVAYQPPQIEELLDQARQQLQTAIDDTPRLVDSLSEELSLADAVQIHSALTGHAAHSSAVLAVQRAELESIAVQREELDQRELEITERSRAIEYLSTELSSRESQLLSRENEVVLNEGHLNGILAEFSQREQSLVDQEQALQMRNQADAAASQLIAEMTRSLEAEQVRLRQLDASIQLQVHEFKQQSLALAQRSQALESFEAELATRAEALQQQAQSVQTLVAFTPVDTSHVELREAAVAKREALLATSTAALQATREQISTEAAELEQRFEALLQREQDFQQQQSALAEQTRQTDASTRISETVLAELTEREQTVANSLVTLTDKEATLQKFKAELEGRDRELRAQRSELDIQEEALHQQFSQLQLDRSAMRAAQSKLQLVEQAAKQRLVTIPVSSDQPAGLIEQRARLDQDRAEFLQERETLEGLRLQIEEQRKRLEQEQSDQALLSASEVNQFEIDNEWQKLAAERARLVAERRELGQVLAASKMQPHNSIEPEPESNEVSTQLLALVSERHSLAELRENLLREQHALHSERDEVRQMRTQFDQDYQQILAIKAESVSERDTYILERQSVISERQSLQDRERQIKQTEVEIEQLRQQAQQLQTEAGTARHQMTTQRVHLEEEWASLRQERAELKRAESELSLQREELTSLAQQLSDLGSVQPTSTPEPVVATFSSPPPVPMTQAVERPLAPTLAAPAIVDIPFSEIAPSASFESDSSEEAAEEAIDPLAGFASFSAIGSGIEDELPPEIAEIMRKAGGYSPSPGHPPRHSSFSETAQASLAPPALSPSELSKPSIEAREEQRLRDLLSRTSESYVEAATARVGDEPDTYDVVEDEAGVEAQSTWTEESPAEEYSESSHSPQTQDSPPQPEPKASELRSRLSEMFGIDLGRFRQPAAPQPEDIVPPAVELPQDEPQSEYSSDEEEYEPEPQALESLIDTIEEEPTAHVPIDEALDPVAAYMEQLLARTRKSKDGHAEKKPAPAPQPAPPPVVPVVIKQEPQMSQVVEAEPSPARPPRKLEAAEKQAIRANLDSFREIANVQARSNVARSELRRLRLAKKLKQVFLAISGGIALILVTTELWTTRRYRLEMTAAMLATAFLAYDYFRTQKRLRELESIAPLEADSDADEGGEA